MFTSMEIRLERAGICQSCEHYKRSTKQCKECGCLVNLKVTLADTACPIGKWQATAPGNDFAAEVSSKLQNFFKSKK
jgi:hypothetical protein